MKRNIELKAKCGDLDGAIRAAERLGATPSGELAQVDTYYRVADGRLKLRREGGRCELIAYSRPDREGARKSEYRVVPVSNGDALHEALASTLGVAGEVRKVRLLYLHDDVRIHLDRVGGLGSYIEFEAMVGDRCGEAEAGEKVALLTEHFSIGEGDVIAGSYSDLLGFGARRG